MEQYNRQASHRAHRLAGTVFGVLGLVTLLVPLNPASADTVAIQSIINTPIADIRNLYSEQAVYKILRKGKRVGTHTVLITPDPSGEDNNFTVSVDSKIRITIMKVPVFSFRYRATESWVDDRLASINATTVKNNEKKEVSATLTNDSMKTRITKDPDSGEIFTETAAPVSFVSNHWHPAVIDSSRIYNTLTGKVDDVAIEILGRETLTLQTNEGATQQPAIRVRYSGGFEAESWYGDDGRWLQLLFKGTDGSLITYQYVYP